MLPGMRFCVNLDWICVEEVGCARLVFRKRKTRLQSAFSADESHKPVQTKVTSDRQGLMPDFATTLVSRKQAWYDFGIQDGRARSNFYDREARATSVPTATV